MTPDNFITPYGTQYNRPGRSIRDGTAQQSHKHTDCKKRAPSQEGNPQGVQANQRTLNGSNTNDSIGKNVSFTDMTFVCNSQGVLSNMCGVMRRRPGKWARNLLPCSSLQVSCIWWDVLHCIPDTGGSVPPTDIPALCIVQHVSALSGIL